MERSAAWSLLNEHVKNPALLRHCLAVEAAMHHYAIRFGEDKDLWGVVGLLHDFDYERYPEPPAHTQEGAIILRAHHVDEQIVGAILSHADWNLTTHPRDTQLRKTLFAVDELCGFLVACALVRPQRLAGMTAKSVRKKMKTPAFAAAVNREDIANGAALLDIDLNKHIGNCVAALTAAAEVLDLMPEA